MIRTPAILVVDEFLPDPDRVRAIAMGESYIPGGDLYKASRSENQHLSPDELGLDLRAEFERLLGRKIARFEEHTMCGKFHYTTPRDLLVYHADGQSHAGALYLTPNAPFDAGTSFWRSRGVPHVRRSSDISGNEEVERTVFGENGANLTDRTRWDEVDRVGNVYNRLALWRGDMIHSATQNFGSTVDDGRIVQVYFFDCE